ncbi:hypothetical protein K474DRAFT_1695189 [Panus rudis PR-1116 ss-1]|nr:hypothetical protein K474DRAFT_1695189 [Panus rudis PR-1116 ss-1]
MNTPNNSGNLVWYRNIRAWSSDTWTAECNEEPSPDEQGWANRQKFNAWCRIHAPQFSLHPNIDFDVLTAGDMKMNFSHLTALGKAVNATVDDIVATWICRKCRQEVKCLRRREKHASKCPGFASEAPQPTAPVKDQPPDTTPSAPSAPSSSEGERMVEDAFAFPDATYEALSSNASTVCMPSQGTYSSLATPPASSPCYLDIERMVEDVSTFPEAGGLGAQVPAVLSEEEVLSALAFLRATGQIP